MQNLYIAGAIIIVWVGSLLFAQQVAVPCWDQAQLDAEAQGGPGRTESCPVPEKSSSSEQGRSGSPAYEPSFPVRMVESSDEEKRREEKELRSENREQDDLKAQRGMAKSAREGVRVAWWQVGIGLIGAALLAASLIYSARAAIAAQDVLKAERAWMTWEPVTILPATDGDQNSLAFQVNWVNSGRSPAMGFQSQLSIDVTPLGGNIPDFASLPLIPEGMIVGHGTKVPSSFLAISSASADAVLRREAKVYIYSRCVYRDIFDKNIVRETEIYGSMVYQAGGTRHDGSQEFIFAWEWITGRNNAT